MKAWEVVGYTFNGAMYHAECKPECGANEDEPHPVFASDEIEPLDYCDTCLHKFISENPGKPVNGWADHVYIDPDRAEEEVRRQRIEKENASA